MYGSGSDAGIISMGIVGGSLAATGSGAFIPLVIIACVGIVMGVLLLIRRGILARSAKGDLR